MHQSCPRLRCPCNRRNTIRNAPYIVLLATLASYAVYESYVRRQSVSLDFRQFNVRQSPIGGGFQSAKDIPKPKLDSKQPEKPQKPNRKITWVEQPILTMRFDGRLGNQMFEFAAIHAIARQKGMRVFLNISHPLNKLFHIDERFVVRKPCGGFTNVVASCCDFNATLLQDIKNNTCQRIYGYFQSWRFFEPYLESIRTQLTFKDDIVEKARNKLRNIVEYQRKYAFKGSSDRGKCVLTHEAKQTCIFIAMHVRRGDLMLPVRMKEGRPAPPKSYYNHAMNYFREKFSNAFFIIGSDTQEWAAENFAGPDAVVLRDNPPEVDMSLLSQCNHTIMSVGTFGWWLSFLANGTVVYYSKPFAPNSSAAAAYTRYDTDFARPGWIGME